MSTNTVELSVENFREVIEKSQETLVAIYFWAAQDQASNDTLPIIRQIANRHSQHLLLATVDIENEPQVTAQFGIQGLPTLMLVKEGRPVDGAAGPMDEAEISSLLENHLPKPEDSLLGNAKSLIAENDYQEAYALAKQAFELDSQRMDIRFVLADCSIEVGKIDAAEELLSSVTLVDQDSSYQTLIGKIELAKKAAETPEILELQAKLEQQPDSFDIKLQLALQLQQANKVESALELLFSILQKDMNYADNQKSHAGYDKCAGRR